MLSSSAASRIINNATTTTTTNGISSIACHSNQKRFSTTTSTASTNVSFDNLRHFLTLKDLSLDQILHLIRRSLEFKQQIHYERSLVTPNSATTPNIAPTNAIPSDLVKGKTLALLFSKRSTRTRVSAESGWVRLGGHPMFLGKDDIQLGAGGESWRDTATVLGSMTDAILARLGDHEEIELLAKYSSVPVINALTAKYHPLQILADVMTLYETFVPNPLQVPTTSSYPHPLPPLPQGLQVAWIGDSNNILNSLLLTLPRLGVSMRVATPQKYPVDPSIQSYAASLQPESEHWQPGTVVYTSQPAEACKGANVIITDTWISMGQEAEKLQRLKDFAGFKVTESLAKTGGAKEDWKFMHCLPRKQEEVDDEVFYNEVRSLVWGEAENRKYTVMAVFEAFMKPKV
ncbi:ornithine carbamoyltransferase [Chytridiales sp. JEL 0842]|nr:ornithine carbamoyltransferase [Chytridiales sp. JEL 0842]